MRLRPEETSGPVHSPVMSAGAAGGGAAPGGGAIAEAPGPGSLPGGACAGAERSLRPSRGGALRACAMPLGAADAGSMTRIS
jgi:hypothetical protein